MTRATSSSSRTGFGRKSSAPASSASMTASVSSAPVMRMNGSVDVSGRRRSARTSSIPFMPGIPRSATTQPTWSPASASSAAAAVAAPTVRSPARPRATVIRVISSGSSWTRRTEGPSSDGVSRVSGCRRKVDRVVILGGGSRAGGGACASHSCIGRGRLARNMFRRLPSGTDSSAAAIRTSPAASSRTLNARGGVATSPQRRAPRTECLGLGLLALDLDRGLVTDPKPGGIEHSGLRRGSAAPPSRTSPGAASPSPAFPLRRCRSEAGQGSRVTPAAQDRARGTG